MTIVSPFERCKGTLENGYGVGMGMRAIDRTDGQGTPYRSGKEEKDEEEDNLSSGQTEEEEEDGEERSIAQKEEE